MILVESPLPFETVSSPLRATGTANTFEATFHYEVVDATGMSWTGLRDRDLGHRDARDVRLHDRRLRRGGKLVVYEHSAEDGSRINEVESR